MDKYKKNPYQTRIYLVITFLIIISFLTWITGDNPGTLSDFGLNAFTEVLSIAITVFIIDKLIEIRIRKENLPREVAAYRDIQLLMSRFIGFWMNVYDQAVPDKNPQSVEELFSVESFNKMLRYLNLNGSPQVVPERNWAVYFLEKGDDLKERADKIFVRYSNFLDSEVYRLIHYIFDDCFMVSSMKLIYNIMQIDKSEGFPRPMNLGSYFPNPNQEIFNAVIELYNYSIKEYDKLKKYDYNIYKVKISNKGNKEDTPKSMLSDVDLKKQSKELREFRQNKR